MSDRIFMADTMARQPDLAKRNLTAFQPVGSTITPPNPMLRPMAVRNPTLLFRPHLRELHGYTPGEQPKIRGLIKLNTNENPYPPAPKVLKVTQQAVDGRLRLYPNPTADALREKLARFHGCDPLQIIVGNGSDELLAMAVRAFSEPMSREVPPHFSRVQFFWPSYSLYPILAQIHGATPIKVPLAADFGLPSVKELKKGKIWDFRAALSLVTTPNAPSGRGYRTADLEALCEAQKGIIILDEAYVDFAEENALELALNYPHVIVSRTFSKAYSLCFQRVGYFVAHPKVIEGLQKTRDSYNVNGLGQVAAEATLDALPYYHKNFDRIKKSRARLHRELAGMGWAVLPSQTNFILTRPAQGSAEYWLGALRDKKLLVRWFSAPDMNEWLRISIGSETEVDALLQAIRQIQASA
ncbi:MAG TPA: histidinol-phosphate transaminase [Candidatus Limnocylindria bacterium]|jgi:histidinol-phosphate aminotransferase|nr:histidinol-phosphate transaminase [Candidatus Limnocylindria bacterium]